MNNKFKSAVLAIAMLGASVWVAKVSTTTQRIVTDKDLHYYQQTSLASFTVTRPGWSKYAMLLSGGLLLGGFYNIAKSLEQEDEQNSSKTQKPPRQQPRISTVMSESENDDDFVTDRPEEDSEKDIEESLENDKEFTDNDFKPRLPDVSHPLYKEAKRLIESLERMELHSDFVEAIAGPSIIEIVVQPQVIPEIRRRVTVSNIERASSDLQVKLATKKPPVISTSEKGVQIQIPRKDRQVIPFETVNSSWKLSNNPIDVELLLGCDINFKPVRAKFRDLPHWFVLGESGGGKSVLLQCQVADLMMNYSPEAVQLVLSDLKGETFYQIPNDLPWLAQPVAINDPEASLEQILWLIEESERRQKTFESVGVPSWEGYNELMVEQGQPIMPRLIYISDENSDLSEEKGKWTGKWESLMPEFTRKCRSRGINVIVTQQRGTADQISRAVVSNLQGRICLSVVDEPNSKVCIGSSGGENLLGKGDLLAKTKFELIRLQSPYLNPKLKWFYSIPEEYKSGKKVEFKNEIVSTQVEEFEFKIPQPQPPTFHPTKTDWNHIALDSSEEDLRELMKIIESRLKPVDSTPVEVDVEIVESTSTESTPPQAVEEESTDVDSVSTLPSQLSWDSVDSSTFKILYRENYPDKTGVEIETLLWQKVRKAIAEGYLTSHITREILLCSSSRETSSRNYSKIGIPLLIYFLKKYGENDSEIGDKVKSKLLRQIL